MQKKGCNRGLLKPKRKTYEIKKNKRDAFQINYTIETNLKIKKDVRKLGTKYIQNQGLIDWF